MSTLARGNEIERDFYELKAQEFGPLATKDEIETVVRRALYTFRETRADEKRFAHLVR